MLEQLQKNIKHYQQRPLSMGNGQSEAGVLIGIMQIEGEPHLILTERSDQLSTHAGEVALPGGKVDDTDQSVVDTALRESHEEVGLLPAKVQVIGALSPITSRWGVVVTPVVGWIDQYQELLPNMGELESVFTVPISWFESYEVTAYLNLPRPEGDVKVPEYQFGDYRIWGLTAMIINDFLHQLCQLGPPLFSDLNYKK